MEVVEWTLQMVLDQQKESMETSNVYLGEQTIYIHTQQANLKDCGFRVDVPIGIILNAR